MFQRIETCSLKIGLGQLDEGLDLFRITERCNSIDNLDLNFGYSNKRSVELRIESLGLSVPKIFRSTVPGTGTAPVH